MPPTKKPASPAPPQSAPQSAVTVISEQLKRLIHGAAAATLVVGDTGSGKTTLLATYASWVWRKFKIPTRLYAFDPGGYSDDILALINLGIIEVWRPYTRDPEGHLGLPSETIQRAAQGWWPEQIDPATGESPLGTRLLPPSAEQPYARAFDGLTSMCDYSMVDMGHRSAQGTLGGEGANLKTIQSGDLKMGIGNRASVGFTQGKVRDWVMSSLSIPGIPTAPVFTALELKVLDSDTKLPLYGPKIAGQAKTTDVPTWFGATLGACQAKDEKGQPQWRLYLRDYSWPPSDSTPHKCKIRSSAQLPAEDLAQLPDFLADDPEESEKLSRFNIGHLFDTFEAIRMKAIERAGASFPDAPGLKKSTIAPAGSQPPRPTGLQQGFRPKLGPPPSSTVTIVKKEVQAEASVNEVSPPVPPAAAVPLAPTAPGPRPSPAGGTRPSPAGPRPIPRSPIPAAAQKKS